MAKRIKKVYYGSYLPVRRSGTKPFLLRFFPYDKSPIPKSVRQDWSGWYERKYKTKKVTIVLNQLENKFILNQPTIPVVATGGFLL